MLVTERNDASASADESNKEKILRTAVRLFAAKGYENVAMRTIASEVGIKAASIYNHFASKSAILDEVVAVFRSELQKRAMNDDPEDLDGAIASKGAKPLLVEIMTAPLSLVADPQLSDIVRVVTRGQYHHQGIRVFLLEEMFRKPQAMLARVLSRLEEIGTIEPFPVDFLVAELQSVLTASFYQLSLRPEAMPFDYVKTRAAMEKHVDFFWRAVERKT